MHFTKVFSLRVAILALLIPSSISQIVSGPQADPQNDPYNLLEYIASNTPTAIALALIMLIALAQTFYTWRYGAKWMLAMVVGAYTYATGFGFRFGLHYHPDSKGIYIAEYLFIVLSPCAFIAADYVLLGRLARCISCTAHVLLPAHRLTLVFVSSDVTTFIIQAVGGTMTITSQNPTQQLAGTHIFLSGLVLQLVSFTLFGGIYIRFLYRVCTIEHDIWVRDKVLPWYRDWRALAGALALSCIGVLIRSCYRVAELSQGFQGRLATTEAFFYALDTLPLIIAILVYVLFWPGWFIEEKGIIGTKPRASESA